MFDTHLQLFKITMTLFRLDAPDLEILEFKDIPGISPNPLHMPFHNKVAKLVQFAVRAAAAAAAELRRPALAATAARSLSIVARRPSRGGAAASRPGPTTWRPALATAVARSRHRHRCASSFPWRRGRVTVAVVAPPPDRAVTCPRNGGAACLHPRRESQSARPHGSGAAASTIDNEHVSTSYFVSGF